ncbi:MAG: F0F1 ATP synthase subunit B [Alphaproteobacteria bacterium]|nr:F0F1 ATP synthase subunit B [Alphaproteobacteria bacterium]
MDDFFSVPHNWAMLGFLAFVALVGKKGWLFITGWLDGRTAEIKAKLDEASRLRAEAEALLASYVKNQKDAEREAEQILAQARTEAARMAEDAARALELAVTRRTELAKDRIARAEQKALKEVRDVAIDIAVRGAQRLIVAEMDDRQADRMVDDAIRELDRKLH